MTTLDPGRAALAHRIRLLVAAAITYNVVEAVVALGAGTRASTTALIGFGLDSEGRNAWRGRVCCPTPAAACTCC